MAISRYRVARSLANPLRIGLTLCIMTSTLVLGARPAAADTNACFRDGARILTERNPATGRWVHLLVGQAVDWSYGTDVPVERSWVCGAQTGSSSSYVVSGTSENEDWEFGVSVSVPLVANRMVDVCVGLFTTQPLTPLSTAGAMYERKCEGYVSQAGVADQWIDFVRAAVAPAIGQVNACAVRLSEYFMDVASGGSASDIPGSADCFPTGDSDIPTADTLLYAPKLQDVLAKDQRVAQTAPGVAYNMAALAATPADLTTDTTQSGAAGCVDVCVPSRKSINIHGPIKSQDKDYTCGPSSVRNTLLWMTGADTAEATLSTEMHTETSKATYWEYVVKSLNARQNMWTFTGSDPKHGSTRISSAGDLMNRVTAVVAYENHAVVLNVQMSLLKYYGGHVSKHYNMAFGYDHSSGGYIKIADEYDPSRFGYSLRSYGNRNPYGYHAETVADTYAAVAGNKSLIIY
jgi:hypothetical protein